MGILKEGAPIMPVRILHVVTYMCRGGLETFIMNYYRKIDRSKVQFDFLVHRDFEADYDREILELGGRIYRLPRLNPFSYKYLSALDAFFAEHNEYRIVHCHLDCMAGIPLKYAKKHNIPVRIAHSHNSNQTKDFKYPLKLYFKRNIRKNATHLFACSREAGLWMFCTDDFQVIANAIDAKRYVHDAAVQAQVREELGINPATLVIGHVGRFAAQKNHAFLMEIVSAVAQKRADIKAVLVGEGKLMESVRKQAEELGIGDYVIFAGVRPDVDRLLQAMNVFVFPSIYEGLPVSVIEAQAAGLPCLISDKVPIECRKTDLVTQIPLAAGNEPWAEAVLDAAKTPRRNTYSELRASGFDITENAKWLTEFYLEQHKTGENKWFD